jgi:hypothetical protein
MSSDDVDLYGRPGAAQAFAKKLTNAKVCTPKFGDPSPNAATVVGMLGKRKDKCRLPQSSFGCRFEIDRPEFCNADRARASFPKTD